jgi:hypothetical protein
MVAESREIENAPSKLLSRAMNVTIENLQGLLHIVFGYIHV